MPQKTNHANNVQYHSKKMPTHDTKGEMSNSLKIPLAQKEVQKQ